MASTGKRRRRLRGRPAPTTTTKRKCTDRAHWKKQPCGVCQKAVYYVSALQFPLALRSQFGDRIEYPAHTRVCSKCLEANPGAELKVRELPVAKDTRCCHRCGGHGTYLDTAARRWTTGYQWGPSSSPTHRTVVAKVKCKPCDGTGRVPA